MEIIITENDRASFIKEAKSTIKLNGSDHDLQRKLEQEFLAYNTRAQITQFWPNPTHQKVPRSQYELQPLIRTNLRLNRASKISSAGSCFAFEMSRLLQHKMDTIILLLRKSFPPELLKVTQHQLHYLISLHFGEFIRDFCHCGT